MTAPTVIEQHGDYDAMFKAVLDRLEVQTEVVDAFAGAPLPPVQAYDMAIITGSPQSVVEPEPWVDALAEWSRQAHAAGRPVLGVCYGHQLLAYAHGGRVQPSLRGLEMGTYDIELTEAGQDDPLLGALSDGPHLRFHEVHGDVVTELPPGAVHLAKNAHTELQGFRLGAHTWAVQFHPEFTLPIMELYLDARADRVRAMAEAAGLDPEAELAKARASLTDAPHGPALLRRFVELAKQL